MAFLKVLKTLDNYQACGIGSTFLCMLSNRSWISQSHLLRMSNWMATLLRESSLYPHVLMSVFTYFPLYIWFVDFQFLIFEYAISGSFHSLELIHVMLLVVDHATWSLCSFLESFRHILCYYFFYLFSHFFGFLFV